MQYDVAIVGGGIGGAVLANLLARRKTRVLVLERNPGPSNRVRPEILWPSTVALLRTLLPPSTEPQWLLPVQGLRFHRGQRLLARIDQAILNEVGIEPSSTDPNQTREQLLTLGLKEGGFELRRGAAVVRPLIDEKHAGGKRCLGVLVRDVASGSEEEVPAHWTIGDDGPNSVIRQGCGIALETRPFPIELATFAVDWPAMLPQATPHIWACERPAGSALLMLGVVPLPLGKGVCLLASLPRSQEQDATLQATLAAWAQRHPAIATLIGQRNFPRDMVRVHLQWGHAESYGIAGAACVGDAIHPVSPAGGQGANMSVADAAALADLLATGSDDQQIIQDYESRRRSANERSLSFTRGASRVLALPEFGVRMVLSLAFWTVGWCPKLVFRRLARAVRAFEDKGNQSTS